MANDWQTSNKIFKKLIKTWSEKVITLLTFLTSEQAEKYNFELCAKKSNQ
jgi:hypothetical protein